MHLAVFYQPVHLIYWPGTYMCTSGWFQSRLSVQAAQPADERKKQMCRLGENNTQLICRANKQTWEVNSRMSRGDNWLDARWPIQAFGSKGRQETPGGAWPRGGCNTTNWFIYLGINKCLVQRLMNGMVIWLVMCYSYVQALTTCKLRAKTSTCTRWHGYLTWLGIHHFEKKGFNKNKTAWDWGVN